MSRTGLDQITSITVGYMLQESQLDFVEWENDFKLKVKDLSGATRSIFVDQFSRMVFDFLYQRVDISEEKKQKAIKEFELYLAEKYRERNPDKPKSAVLTTEIRMKIDQLLKA